MEWISHSDWITVLNFLLWFPNVSTGDCTGCLFIHVSLCTLLCEEFDLMHLEAVWAITQGGRRFSILAEYEWGISCFFLGWIQGQDYSILLYRADQAMQRGDFYKSICSLQFLFVDLIWQIASYDTYLCIALHSLFSVVSGTWVCGCPP